MSDLISRQDAIEVLDGGAELLRRVLDDLDIVGVERRKYKWGLELFESCISDMKELPSAEPRKKGKWIQINAGYFDYVKCSQCGETLDWGKNYCPNCGADMNGGEEDEDEDE